MKIIFARHGETYHNRKKLIQGQYDGRLTRKGISQAKKLSLRLRNEKIDVAFSSDLSRARRTAEELLKVHTGVPLILSSELRERSHGVFENTLADEFRKYREGRGIPKHVFRPEGGESFMDLEKRLKKFLGSILKKHKGKNVLIVAHGGVNRVLISILAKKPLKDAIELGQHNTCVNIAEINDKTGAAKFHKINCTEHLEK